MKKAKKILYPIYKLFIPLIIIIIISSYLSSIFEIVDYNGNGFLLKLSEITFGHPRRVASFILFVSQLSVVRCYNSKKEFAPTDLYGNYPIFIYNVAFYLLGFKIVNLKMKPIPLQFKLLHQKNFDLIDDTYYSPDEFDYDVSYFGKLDYNSKQINIIVADTYIINEDMIKKTILKNYTIKIDRVGQVGVRTNSKNLINILINEIQKNKSTCKEFNLFLSTPASINKSIYQQVFQTGGRDKFKLNIYQQDNKNNYLFNENPVTISLG